MLPLGDESPTKEQIASFLISQYPNNFIVDFEDIYHHFYRKFIPKKWEGVKLILSQLINEYSTNRGNSDFWVSNYQGYIFEPAPGIYVSKYSIKRSSKLGFELLIVKKVKQK